MITYETLRRMEQEERGSNKLAKLPESFLSEVMEYLKRKGAMAKEKGDRFELQTSSQRFQNVMELRERKLVNFTLSYVRSGAVPEDMLPEEREFFDSLVRKVKEFHDRRNRAMSGQRSSFKTVALLQELPKFVGIDMGHYGPYRQGDMATVPAENAKLLVEKGAAEPVEFG